jgi:hypothetical protein
MGFKVSPVDTLELLFMQEGFPRAEREHYFAKPRMFRFDLAWPALLLAAEFEGGIFAGKKGRGRHCRPEGYSRDAEKYSIAALTGWRVVRVTRLMLDDGRAGQLAEMAGEIFFPTNPPTENILPLPKPKPELWPLAVGAGPLLLAREVGAGIDSPLVRPRAA